MGSGGEPAAVSRRVSVVVGFYRTSSTRSSAVSSDYVRRPAVQRAIETGRPHRRADPGEPSGEPDGPPCRNPPVKAPRS